MYGDGLGFVPDEIKPARTAVVAQNPGEDEEQQGRPMVGKTGQMLVQRMLPRAGLTRDDVCILNVVKCRTLEAAKNGPRRIGEQRFKASNKLPRGKDLNRAMQHCVEAHFRVPDDVDYIIALGSLALRGLGY